jgi:hypothetical protein
MSKGTEEGFFFNNNIDRFLGEFCNHGTTNGGLQKHGTAIAAIAFVAL